jgi:putative polyhydroxyalkanoate system protein
MSDISITQSHTLNLVEARAAAQRSADSMAEQYDISSSWEGDVLTFTRSGVAGTLAVFDREARLDITLGFMLKSFAPMIQEKVARNMAKVFGADAG